MTGGNMMGANGVNRMQVGYSMMDSGMMNGFGGLVDAPPLSIDEATTAVESYLDQVNNDSLVIGEVMIFDNHAYAQVLDTQTGSGAFEVLVDPVTKNVFPEPGPNMMWNTEYGMMGGQYQGMMGGNRSMRFGDMMGRFGTRTNAATEVTAKEAVRLAQEFLDATVPGTTADAQADPFPGYYTIHVLRDGTTVGMLSVNAYDGQVFLHHWHGDFVEMSGEDHS
jgi:hypothetical protein